MRTLIIATLMLGAFAFVVVGKSSAYDEKAPTSSAMPSDQPVTGEQGENNKKQEKQEAKAIAHAKQAIGEGKAGKVDGLTKHAQMALKSAEEAERQHAESHVEAGIKHLQMAIEDGKKGNAAEGTKHVEEALTQLQKE